MLTAMFVVAGAVAAWLLVDRLLLRRDQRQGRGHAAWVGAEHEQDISFDRLGRNRPAARGERPSGQAGARARSRRGVSSGRG